MQTSNRLLYKGGKPIKKAQYGSVIPQGIEKEGIQQMGNNVLPSLAEGMQGLKKVDIPKMPGKGLLKGIGGGMGSLAGAGVEAAMGAIFGNKDHLAGAAEKGLDEAGLAEIENTGSGLGTASKIAGTLGDLGGNLPGPWGFVASGAGQLLESGLGLMQGDKQEIAANKLLAAHADRKSDASKMEGLANMSRKGGVLYKKPNSILSLLSGGVYKDGGKAPELKWNHKFTISLPESTMDKKKIPVRVFKRGGKFSDPDKTNVIISGARHHEKNSLGDNGVPVIDQSGEKVFEVEKGELILTKDVTNKIESFLSKYKKVEIDEDKAHEVLKSLGSYFKEEISENLHNYEENVV